MTHEEYIQLVQSSEVFRALEESFQKIILAAKDEEQDRYIQIFMTEHNGILAAQKALAESNEAVLRDFDAKVKKTGKEFIKTAEVSERASAAAKAEDLLNSV
ncbi:hypothetical protein KKH03_02025 [Patescibacteria group bacterium]|nr:hypothetical protein [Patescibacteria group bacterium]